MKGSSQSELARSLHYIELAARSRRFVVYITPASVGWTCQIHITDDSLDRIEIALERYGLALPTSRSKLKARSIRDAVDEITTLFYYADRRNDIFLPPVLRYAAADGTRELWIVQRSGWHSVQLGFGDGDDDVQVTPSVAQALLMKTRLCVSVSSNLRVNLTPLAVGNLGTTFRTFAGVIP